MMVDASGARPVARRELGLTPLADVVFLLLAFFMLAGEVQRMDRVRVLPPASASEARPPRDRVELVVEADGSLWLQDERIALTALAPVLTNSAKPPLVKADANLPVEILRGVLAELRRAGAREAALATRSR